jgi:CHAD domain-containing protein
MGQRREQITAIDVERVRKPVRKLRKFLKKAPKDPSADKIHHLRTSARRFETAVEALDLGPVKRHKALLKDLTKVRRSAGKIRDMDVLISKVATLDMDDEQRCLVALLEALEARRAKHLKKLRAAVAKRGSRLSRQLNREASRMAQRLEIPETDGAEKENHAGSIQLAAEALRLTKTLKAPAHLSKRNLHAYRVKVRQLAYLLQMANSADQEDFVKKLFDIKDVIGEWHDWGELLATATKVLDHGKECRLLRSLRIITAGKYSQAILMTNRMRKLFLKPAAIRVQLFGNTQKAKRSDGRDKSANGKEDADIFPVEKDWLLR